MRRSIIAMACACSMLGLTGCADLREALKSKETQGMILGGLLGAAAMTSIQYASDHHAGALGSWAAGGGLVGALAGYFIGHTLKSESDEKPSTY